MKFIWYYVYNLAILPLLIIFIYSASLFNEKLRTGLRDRTILFSTIENSLPSFDKSLKRIWIHVSSMGEFEQAKPMIEALKNRLSKIAVILTFFSPSGYRNSKNYPYADIITYLPLDTRRNAVRFIQTINPDIAVFIRYDLWPNHIWMLAEKNIPTILVNATLREGSTKLIPPFSSFYKELYNNFTYIFTVDKTDARHYQRFNLVKSSIEVTGDTRYDRVSNRNKEKNTNNILPDDIIREKKIVLVGSSWRKDEELIIPALADIGAEEDNLLNIIVPHEPTTRNIEFIESLTDNNQGVIRYSTLNNYNGEKTIIVDRVGILPQLYRYASVAYIGGGFHHGVHNVLEAAVYSLPVVIGPKYERSPEAIELVNIGGAVVVTDFNSVLITLRYLLQSDTARERVGTVGRKLVGHNIGATEKITNYLSIILEKR